MYHSFIAVVVVVVVVVIVVVVVGGGGGGGVVVRGAGRGGAGRCLLFEFSLIYPCFLQYSKKPLENITNLYNNFPVKELIASVPF